MPLGIEVGLGPDRSAFEAPALHTLRLTTHWIKVTLGMEVGLDPGHIQHILLDWDPPSLYKKGAQPLTNFWPISLVANGWMHQDATWYGAAPPKKMGRSPRQKNSTHVYCGQKGACIQMPLGMEVCFSPVNFVLDRDAPAPEKGGAAPQFSAHIYFRPISIFGPYLLTLRTQPSR